MLQDFKQSQQQKGQVLLFMPDVRMRQRRQVESLGGKFLMVKGRKSRNRGWICEETSEDFKKQEELLSETLKKLIL